MANIKDVAKLAGVSVTTVSRDAQMAESVDALVSNTSGFTSIPVRPRVWVLKRRKLKNSLRFSFLSLVTRWFKWVNVTI